MNDSSIVSCAGCGKRNRVPTVTTGSPRCAACHAPLPWMVDATGADFAAIVKAPVLVLVDLWAPWCGPCRTVGPLAEQAAKDLAGRLKVVKVNVDVAPEISQQFGVQGIPTLLLLREGKEVNRQVGALPGHALRAWIDGELARNGS
ncbi:MAG: thioredoxin [Ilumatobacteraceae bacterium]